MVAEVVPEDRRAEAGALLQTAAPLGLLAVALVNLLLLPTVLETGHRPRPD